jgi:FAD/FMN-containing dehydrogenase
MNDHSAGWDHGFTPQDIAALSSITEGPVLLAGDPGLAVEVSSPDITNTHEPALVVGATNAADVQAAARFSLDFRLPLAVMSPDHHAPSSAKGGVLITTSRMNQIHLDRRSRTAIVGAGASWSDVVDRAAELDLAPLIPSYPGIGIVGRAFGWTSGHVRSVEVVAPDGELHHVTAASDPRMFRRLCDSDISDIDVGIITAMTFALFR